MSIYLDERNPGKHAPFEDAAPDIVEYVRYLEVIAGKSANTAFNYYCQPLYEAPPRSCANRCRI